MDVRNSVFSKPFHGCVSAADEGSEDGIERTCDTLLMCIVTVLNQGLRNGGGVGDVLRRPSKDVSKTERVCFKKHRILSFLPSLGLSLLTLPPLLPLFLPPSPLSFLPVLGIDPITETYPQPTFYFLNFEIGSLTTSPRLSLNLLCSPGWL